MSCTRRENLQRKQISLFFWRTNCCHKTAKFFNQTQTKEEFLCGKCCCCCCCWHVELTMLRFKACGINFHWWIDWKNEHSFSFFGKSDSLFVVSPTRIIIILTMHSLQQNVMWSCSQFTTMKKKATSATVAAPNKIWLSKSSKAKTANQNNHGC